MDYAYGEDGWLDRSNCLRRMEGMLLTVYLRQGYLNKWSAS